jgi:hypothetical protein
MSFTAESMSLDFTAKSIPAFRWSSVIRSSTLAHRSHDGIGLLEAGTPHRLVSAGRRDPLSQFAACSSTSVSRRNLRQIAALQHGISNRHYDMSGNVVEMRPKAQSPSTSPLAEEKAIGSMMWSMELGGMGKSATALIEAVVQTNLQAMQELVRVDSAKALLKLQQRFACDYMAALTRGTMAIVDAIEAARYARAALAASQPAAA